MRNGKRRASATYVRAPRVLVVDDVHDTRELYAEYLRAMGFSTTVAADGGEALAIARRERPDVVVLDLGLPVTDGWSVARRLKSDEETRHAWIIALSGYVDPSYEASALEAGCDEFIAKPCLPERLLRAVFGGRRARA